jgi:sialic acid synthase SpsE
MVEAAARAGATHAKIQNIYSHELTYRDEFEANSPNQIFYRPYASEFERLSQLDLSEQDEKIFVEKCNQLGITPMTTVFTHDGVKRAIKAGFKSIKIASYDCESLPLIHKVANFATELVISTGATSLSNVKKTLEMVQDKVPSLFVLHARTLYPNTLKNLNIMRMIQLSGLGCKIGLSDHSSTLQGDLSSSFLAISLGAEAIERHFTILPLDKTKDGPVSINQSQLAEIAAFANSSRRNKISWLAEFLSDLSNQDSIAIPSEEFSEEEINNKHYYKGRLASQHKGQTCPSWLPCDHFQ